MTLMEETTMRFANLIKDLREHSEKRDEIVKDYFQQYKNDRRLAYLGFSDSTSAEDLDDSDWFCIIHDMYGKGGDNEFKSKHSNEIRLITKIEFEIVDCLSKMGVEHPDTIAGYLVEGFCEHIG